MRTYLPEPNLARSVRVLHPNELYTAVASAADTLSVLHETFDSEIIALYDGHPEVNKWRGHEVILSEYGLLCVTRLESLDPQALSRGQTRAHTVREIIQWHFESATSGGYSMDMPAFMGKPEFHAAERAELIRLAPQEYRRKYPDVDYATPLQLVR